MKILGLTGSIGMGKSVAATMLRHMGVPVHESDTCVHELLQPQGVAYASVAAAFPQMLAPDRSINRAALGALVFHDAQARRQLEQIIHPLVQQSQIQFLEHMRRTGQTLAVLDIPLLYETGAEARVDAVIVVTAPRFIQRARVLARPGMSEEKLQKILSIQMPDSEKRRRADYIVQTGLGRVLTRRQLHRIVKKFKGGAR
ncbi:MAG: dephospho-CoA kinase [Alphaproteobacteria bacterium]|nr:dephospho-CoA kinase [Alphaproteobacteria bacterium]